MYLEERFVWNIFFQTQTFFLLFVLYDKDQHIRQEASSGWTPISPRRTNLIHMLLIRCIRKRVRVSSGIYKRIHVSFAALKGWKKQNWGLQFFFYSFSVPTESSQQPEAWPRKNLFSSRLPIVTQTGMLRWISPSNPCIVNLPKKQSMLFPSLSSCQLLLWVLWDQVQLPNYTLTW